MTMSTKDKQVGRARRHFRVRKKVSKNHRKKAHATYGVRHSCARLYEQR